MPLSWNEIRHNAIKFSGEWKGAKSEHAEKQTFWNEFFQVFGIKRRVVASFEEPAKRISGTYGFIDLLWRCALPGHRGIAVRRSLRGAVAAGPGPVRRIEQNRGVAGLGNGAG